jgi:hypothetical protein
MEKKETQENKIDKDGNSDMWCGRDETQLN